MNLGAKVKLTFFDSAAVIAAVDKATRKVLSRFGAYVRQTALRSIPEARSPADYSKPGEPPHSHGRLMRRAANRRAKAAGRAKARGMWRGIKYILFGYDATARSVVIGPATNRTRETTTPEVLEYGRKSTERRPFMGPAFQKEQKGLAAMWADSV